MTLYDLNSQSSHDPHVYFVGFVRLLGGLRPCDACGSRLAWHPSDATLAICACLATLGM